MFLKAILATLGFFTTCALALALFVILLLVALAA